MISIPALFGKNDIPFAFFALTGICTVGLYLAYIIPVYLRLRAGDSFEPGPWNLGAQYKLVNTIAILFVVLVVFALDLPYTPAGLPWNDGFDASLVNYTPLRDPAAADLRRLVPGLGEEQVPGPGQHARGGRRHQGLTRSDIHGLRGSTRAQRGPRAFREANVASRLDPRLSRVQGFRRLDELAPALVLA